MNYLVTSLIITFLSIIFFACTKHRGDYEEHLPAASIQFASPTEGYIYNHGDSVMINATAISSETIHGYDISIKNTADTTIYFKTHVHDHNDILNIHQGWRSTLSESASLEAIITLTLDHDGHTLTKRTGFKIR